MGTPKTVEWLPVCPQSFYGENAQFLSPLRIRHRATLYILAVGRGPLFLPRVQP